MNVLQVVGWLGLLLAVDGLRRLLRTEAPRSSPRAAGVVDIRRWREGRGRVTAVRRA